MLKIEQVVFILFAINILPSSVEAQRRWMNDVPSYTLNDLDIITVDPPPPRTSGEFGEKQTWLTYKRPAPFAGVLINEEGMAYVLSEYAALQERAMLALERQRATDLALLNKITTKLHLEYDAKLKKNALDLWETQAKLKDLEKYHEAYVNDRSGWKRKFLIGLGAGAGGALVGILIGLFAI